MGLFDSESDIPMVKTIDVDDGTKGLIKDQVGRAQNSSAESEYQNMMDQTNKGEGLLTEATSYSPTTASKAIQSLAKKKFAQSMGQLNATAQVNAPLKLAANNARALGNVRALNSVYRQNQERLFRATQNEQAARNQVISSVFAIGGTIAGAYFGGPAGAMAGNQIGSKMGGDTTMRKMGGDMNADYGSDSTGGM